MELNVYASDIEDRGCPGSEGGSTSSRRSTGRATAMCWSRIRPSPKRCELSSTRSRLDSGSSCCCSRLTSQAQPSAIKRLHKLGHLRRVHALAERLQDMHDANFTGEKASQSQDHAWFVLDRNYCGPSTIVPVSINDPTARMPWQHTAPLCGQCGRGYQPQRSVRGSARQTCRQRAHYRKQLSVRLSVRTEPASSQKSFATSGMMTFERFTAEGWELLPALNGTHHGEYSALMRRGGGTMQGKGEKYVDYGGRG